MAEDLLYYVDRRSKLDLALKEGVPFSPTYSGHVGLINQGSNAFNSLIQCLFYNVPFRNLILLENSDTTIFKAIQETFCYLQLSESCAVSTNELVSAFRWSRGEVFEQHDVHELFGLLLDSLGDEVPDLRASLSKLFRGSMTDVLSCPNCTKKLETESSFLNFSLELDQCCSTGRRSDSSDAPPVINTAPRHLDLKKLVEVHMRSEIMDVESKWECPSCCSHVQAVKHHEYRTLPPNLMIHLQRLKYNSDLSKREKLTTPVYFPCLLDVSSLTRRVPDQGDIASHGKHNDEVGDIEVPATGCTYRLHSILLHTGTASGGHYKAYVLDSGTGRWLECNGACVCELSTREEASLFLQASTVLAEPDSNDDARAFEGNGKNSVSRSRSRESIKKFVTLRDDVLRENAYMFLYQKVSNDIVISSLCNNDIASGIYSREEKDEVSKLLEKCISAVPTSLAKRILEENADLQELRRLNDIHKKIVALKILYKHPTEGVTGRMTGKCSKFMGNARDEFKVVHQLALSSQTLNEVIRTVCPLLSLPLQSSSASSQAPAISQEGQDKKVSKGSDNSNSIKCTDTLYYRLREFSEISWRKGATYGSRGDESLASLGFSLLNTGISSHSPVVLLLETRTADDPPFEEEIDQVMLLRALVWTEELTVAMETSLDFLETLSCLFPLNSDSSGSVIDVNTDHTTAAIRDTMLEILVPGELTATLGALRDAVATQLKKSTSEIILLLVNQAGALLMEPDQDHRSLGKAYGIKPGDLIFVEIGPSFSPPPSPSSTAPDSPSIDFLTPCVTESVALCALDRRLTSIVIYFNDPRKPAPAAAAVPQTGATLPDQTPSDSKTPCKDEHFLRVSPHIPLRDFKMLISDKLNIDLKVEDFYMSRNDLSSPSPSPSQLKDVTLTLHEAGLRTQGSVFLQAGLGCAVGEHFLHFDCKSEEANHTSDVGSIVMVTNTNTDSATTSVAPSSEKPACPRQLIVHELITVLQLKQQLLDEWDTELSSGGSNLLPSKPQSPHHIRLRDVKVPGSSGLGTLLRNERVLARCLPGISDGRKISLLVLREAEIIDPLDWILSVKIITYSSPVTSTDGSKVLDAVTESTDSDEAIPTEGCVIDYTVRRVHRAVDLPVSRSATLRQLYQALLVAFPHLREIPTPSLVKPIAASTTLPTTVTTPTPSITNQITSERNLEVKDESVEFVEKSLLSIAKGFSSGAPLTLQTSLKSAWDPLGMVSSPDLKIDHPVFGFRDGVILLVRGASDWQRAVLQDPSLLQGLEGDAVQKPPPARSAMKPLGSWKSRSSGGVRMARAEKALSLGDLPISREEPPDRPDKSALNSIADVAVKCSDVSGAEIDTEGLTAICTMSLKPDSTLVENSTSTRLTKCSSLPLLLPSAVQQLSDVKGPP